jgi:futalosine hydrolase
LETGDLAVATSEALAELGVCTGDGTGSAKAMGPLGMNRGNPLDEEMARELADAGGNVANAALGGFLTVIGVSSNRSQAQTRERQFRVLVENMEGYALALVGLKLGIKVGEIRGVSNPAGIRDKSAWNLGLANERAQLAVLSYLRRNL